jgi:hypothetical protein
MSFKAKMHIDYGAAALVVSVLQLLYALYRDRG